MWYYSYESYIQYIKNNNIYNRIHDSWNNIYCILSSAYNAVKYNIH